MSVATIAATLSTDPTEYQPSSDGVNMFLQKFWPVAIRLSFRRVQLLFKVNRRYGFGATVFFNDGTSAITAYVDMNGFVRSTARISIIKTHMGCSMLVIMRVNV